MTTVDMEQRAFEQLKIIVSVLQEMTVEGIVAMLERQGIKGKVSHIENNNDINSPLAQWISKQIDWPYGVSVGKLEIWMNASLYHLRTPESIYEFERNWRNGKYPQITEK